MSLINEALKRAEAREADNTSPVAPPEIPPARGNKPKRKMPRVLISLVLIIVSLAALAARNYSGMDNSAMPPASAAAVSSHRNIEAKQPEKTTVQTSQNRLHENFADQTHQIAHYDPAIEKTLEAVNYFKRPEREEVAAADSIVSINRKDTVENFGSSAAGEKITAEDTKSAFAEESVAAGRAADAGNKINPDTFTLDGVMQGPAGGTAIINGRHVRIGQEIKGARVVNIEQYEVILEADGEKFTIGM